MVDLEKMSLDGFKLLNGRIYDRYGASVLEYDASVRKECGEYHFTNYSYSAYSIVKSVHYDEWYLKKGYLEVCRLRYLGGENWETC